MANVRKVYSQVERWCYNKLRELNPNIIAIYDKLCLDQLLSRSFLEALADLLFSISDLYLSQINLKIILKVRSVFQYYIRLVYNEYHLHGIFNLLHIELFDFLSTHLAHVYLFNDLLSFLVSGKIGIRFCDGPKEFVKEVINNSETHFEKVDYLY